MFESSGRRMTGSVVFAVVLLAGFATAARAGTITVNSFEDLRDADLTDGVCDADLATPGLQCTLRAAVQHANVTPGGDTIELPAGTYRLTIRNRKSEDANAGDAATGDLDLTDAVTISGAAAFNTIIDCRKLKDRAFDVEAIGRAIQFNNLTIVSGRTGRRESGGAIRNVSGTMSMFDCVLSRCKAAAEGGGLSLGQGNAFLRRVWIDSCSAKDGGGIGVSRGSLAMDYSTISKCKAGREGGGVLLSDGYAVVVLCTISGNKGTRVGGGFSLEDGSELSIQSCTVAYNKAKLGGGVSVTDEARATNSCTVLNSIFAFNGKANSDRALTSDGGNVDSGSTCGFERSNVDPLLQPLAPNGGTTPSHQLEAASPARDFGVALFCDQTDQRGVLRVIPCDSGSYEYIPGAK